MYIITEKPLLCGGVARNTQLESITTGKFDTMVDDVDILQY